MNKNKSFHPKLIIVDHFDEIKNQIDIKTETLLCDQNLVEDNIKILNGLRQAQIEKIDEIKNKNLSRVKTLDYDAFNSKWNNFQENSKMKFEQQADIIKENLIAYDCILIEDSQFKSDISLWLTPFFYNLKNLEFLRYLYFLNLFY